MHNRRPLYSDRSFRDVPDTPSATITSLPTPVNASYYATPSFADVVRMAPPRPEQSSSLSPNCLFMSLSSEPSRKTEIQQPPLDSLRLDLSTASRFFNVKDDEESDDGVYKDKGEPSTAAAYPEEAAHLEKSRAEVSNPVAVAAAFSPMPSNDGRRKGSYADAVRGTLSPKGSRSAAVVDLPTLAGVATSAAAITTATTTCTAVVNVSPALSSHSPPLAPLLKDTLSSFGSSGLSAGTFGNLGSEPENENAKNGVLFIHPTEYDYNCEPAMYDYAPAVPDFDHLEEQNYGNLGLGMDPRHEPTSPRNIDAWRHDIPPIPEPPSRGYGTISSSSSSKRPRSVTEDDDSARPRTRPQPAPSTGIRSAPIIKNPVKLSKEYMF